MRLDRLHRAYPSLHPVRVVLYIGYQSCRTSRQRLGVNQIDSCNFELFTGTVVNNYQFNGIQGWAWAAMSNKMPGCHLANAWRNRSKHILQWRYRNEVSVQFNQSIVRTFIMIHLSHSSSIMLCHFVMYDIMLLCFFQLCSGHDVPSRYGREWNHFFRRILQLLRMIVCSFAGLLTFEKTIRIQNRTVNI